MQTIVNQSINTSYSEVIHHVTPWTRFMNYCKGQERNRILWVGFILAIHGCVLTPVTAMITYFSGGNFTLFMLAMIAMGIALVTNLAAMPTKVTIPAFAFSVLMDIAIIISSVVLLAS